MTRGYHTNTKKTKEKALFQKNLAKSRLFAYLYVYKYYPMATPTQRRTSSSKGRGASHLALKAQMITKNKAGVLHHPHQAAPGATEYNGKPIHIKGGSRLLGKLTKKKTAGKKDEHAGHNHA